ncbi:hypothetical protein quinque_008194 [Culex quinquefasciatus]
MDSGGTVPSKIPVYFQHNRGFIYDVEDYLTLRFTHRIAGNLIGVPASKPRNSHVFGLPAALSAYELRLALEKGLVALVDRTSGLERDPDDGLRQQYEELVRRQGAEQKAPVVEKRIREFRSYLPKIVEGKRKKMLKSGVKEEDINIDPEQLIAEERRKLELMEFDRLIQIPMEHPLNIERAIIDFDLSGEHERLKYRVFRDIWEKQNVFISGGDAFGCDFLLYPGDPLYYHASHMIHVIADADHRLDVKYMIRCCRLSVVVNKICVFAYAQRDTGDICYQTVEWEGNVGNEF